MHSVFNMSSIDMATRLKIGMYPLNRKSVTTNAFPKSTCIYNTRVFKMNWQPIKKIEVQQYRLLYPTHVDNNKKKNKRA